MKLLKNLRYSNFMLIWIMAFMSALAPLATDMYLPALKDIQAELQTTESLLQLSITVFFLAFAFGQLIYGPLSDAYGRRKPVYIGIVIYTLSSLACALVHSVYAFIFCRFLQALGGCAGVVIARAIINDKYNVKEGASILAIMMMVGSLAPMLAPALGSLIQKYTCWEFIFGILFIFGLMLLSMMIWSLPETGKRDSSLKFDAVSVFKNYLSIVQDRRYLIFVLSFSITLASIFAYITAASYTFQDYFQLTEQKFGILFGINTIGSTMAAIINAKIVRKLSPYIILQYAFPVMIAFALCLALAGYLDLGFLFFEISLFFTMAMIGFIAPNTTVLAMARFKHKSGAASGLLGMIQFSCAGFVSFLVGLFHANSPAGLATMMALCIFSGWGIYLSINRRAVAKWKKRLQNIFTKFSKS